MVAVMHASSAHSSCSSLCRIRTVQLTGQWSVSKKAALKDGTGPVGPRRGPSVTTPTERSYVIWPPSAHCPCSLARCIVSPWKGRPTFVVLSPHGVGLALLRVRTPLRDAFGLKVQEIPCCVKFEATAGGHIAGVFKYIVKS